MTKTVWSASSDILFTINYVWFAYFDERANKGMSLLTFYKIQNFQFLSCGNEILICHGKFLNEKDYLGKNASNYNFF